MNKHTVGHAEHISKHEVHQFNQICLHDKNHQLKHYGRKNDSLQIIILL